MMKNFRYAITLTSVLSAFIFVQGCAKEKLAETAPLQSQAHELLVSSESLRQADLEIDFSYVVPIQPAERLKTFALVADRIYTVSGRNYLLSLDREKVLPVYSWQLAPPSATFCGLTDYGSQIYSIVGADLVSLDHQEGTESMRRAIGFGPICPPARNTHYYYVPGTDKRVHVMRASDMVQVFEVSANDDGLITCVRATDDFVAFATDAGTLLAMRPDGPVQIWRFKADAGINAPVAYDDRELIFSSKDAYVYAIDHSRGKLIWKYLTPAILTDGPKVTQRYVYQYVTGHGLIAIDKANGTLAWQLPEGIDLLAEDGRRIYVMAKNRKLVVFDNKNLKKLYEVDMPGVSKWATNTVDARIYLADDAGRIACIKPIKY